MNSSGVNDWKNKWIIDKEMSEYVFLQKKNLNNLFVFILDSIILIIENIIKFLLVNLMFIGPCIILIVE